MQVIADGYVPQIVCLTSQTIATIYTLIKLNNSQQQFPVKQLSPIMTAAALMCFFLANIVSFTGRIVQDLGGYYVKGLDIPQCRTNGHPQMVILGVIFCILRELPLIFFSLKTLRVSLCFFPSFNRIQNRQINQYIIKIFKTQSYLIAISIIYVVFINMLTLILIWLNPAINNQGIEYYDYSGLLFQFFCPGKSTNFDFVIIVIRFLLFAIAYIMSIWTYRQLDFKRFLIIIFFLSNILTFLRLVLIYQNSADKTYHQFYYGSFIICLLGTIFVAYYSRIYDLLMQPPQSGILHYWSAFTNYDIGMNLLVQYSIDLDARSTIIRYHFACLQSFMFLDKLLKQDRSLQNEDYQILQKILSRNEVIKLKLAQRKLSNLIQDCKRRELQIYKIKQIQTILSTFCQQDIFREWKKTNSFRHLKDQFEQNADINSKLQLFMISIN